MVLSKELEFERVWHIDYGFRMKKNPFRYFKTSFEIIQLAVMMHARFPLSLRNMEDLLHERGIDICHESVRLWVDRLGTMFSGQIRKRRAGHLHQIGQWRWHFNKVFVKINGETHYLWCAVDHEGEVLEAYAIKKRNKAAALRFLKGNKALWGTASHRY